jgi:hypothetical protein
MTMHAFALSRNCAAGPIGAARHAWLVSAALLLAGPVLGAAAGERCAAPEPACILALAAVDARRVEDTPRRALLLARAGVVAAALGRDAAARLVDEGIETALGLEDAAARAATLIDIVLLVEGVGVDGAAARGAFEAAAAQLPPAEGERLRAELRDAPPLPARADGTVPPAVGAALPATDPWRQSQDAVRLAAEGDVATARRLARAIAHPGWRADALTAIVGHATTDDAASLLAAADEAMAATAAVAEPDWRASVRLDLAQALPAGF